MSSPQDVYLEFSRFTDPGRHREMLHAVPSTPVEIAEFVGRQSVHYRMLSQWRIPLSEWRRIPARPNESLRVSDLLEVLKASGPGDLASERHVLDRVMAACAMESVFLVSLLRFRGIPARVRLGYLSNLYRGSKATTFWLNVNEIEKEGKWSPDRVAETTEWNARINKSIEHWIAEYWDAYQQTWRLLDPRPEYLGAYGIDVGVHLPKAYFEYAWEAWQDRAMPDFNPERYREADIDGCTHIRQQLLGDFFFLLNHDAAGRDSSNSASEFIKERTYSSLGADEIAELDELARLMGRDPSVDQLVAFYWKSKTLRLADAEDDKYSFVFCRRT